MIKKLLYTLLLAAIAYILHGRYLFSQDVVSRWLEAQSNLALKGDPKACDAYADDLTISISTESRFGRRALHGGKPEMCEHLRQTAGHIQTLRALPRASFHDMVIIQREFPWTEATVSYTRKVRLLPSDRGPLDVQQADTLTLARSLRGLRIVRVHSVIYPASP